jgi:hypothetical protein
MSIVVRNIAALALQLLCVVGPLVWWAFAVIVPASVLIATTAAGRHRVSIPDLPVSQVWPIIEAISLQHEELSPGQYLARYAASV